jgi:hypothetical protein
VERAVNADRVDCIWRAVLPAAPAKPMVRWIMTLRPSSGGCLALVVATAAALAGDGCDRATLPDQGPVRPGTVAFSIQPEYAMAGTPIQPGVAVTVIESNGDTAYYSSAEIQLTILSGTGTPGAHLLGTAAVAAVNGTAFFADVSIDSAGTGYQLVAVGPSLGAGASRPFDVTAGPPARLVFRRPPGAAVAGDAIPAFDVLVEDRLGNRELLAANPITIALGANPRSGVLSGPTTATADSGVAAFAGLAIDTPGTGYTLVASTPGLQSDTTAPFTVTAPVRGSRARGPR